MTYQGARQRLHQALTPPRPASQRGSSEKRDTNQRHGWITYTTGPPTSHKGNFLLYCERHYIKLKLWLCFESVQFLPQTSTLQHLSWLQLLQWANLRSASIWVKGFICYLEIMHTFKWCYVKKMGIELTRDKNPLALPILYKGFLTSSHALPSK